MYSKPKMSYEQLCDFIEFIELKLYYKLPPYQKQLLHYMNMYDGPILFGRGNGINILNTMWAVYRTCLYIGKEPFVKDFKYVQPFNSKPTIVIASNVPPFDEIYKRVKEQMVQDTLRKHQTYLIEDDWLTKGEQTHGNTSSTL